MLVDTENTLTNTIQHSFSLLSLLSCRMDKLEGKTTDYDQSGCHATTSIWYAFKFL
jgi:hypothetical protein